MKNKITRVVIVTEGKKKIEIQDCKEVNIEYQDNGRTLKVFIK